MIPLTVPEVCRLVYRLVVRSLAPPEAVLHWSRWRRQHQAGPNGPITSAASLALAAGAEAETGARDD